MQKEEYFQKMETALANHGIVSRVDRGDIVEENKYMSPGNGPGGNFRQEYHVSYDDAQLLADAASSHSEQVALESDLEENVYRPLRKRVNSNQPRGLFVKQANNGSAEVHVYFIPNPE